MSKIFGGTSTTDDVLAGLGLKGKRVLVTGTSSGLGIETARALVARRFARRCVSSNAHRMSDIDLEDLNFERRAYDPVVDYGLEDANALFAVEFDRRHKDRGVRAVAVHLGTINTVFPKLT